jgi:hypothetical protein
MRVRNYAFFNLLILCRCGLTITNAFKRRKTMMANRELF